VVSRSVRRSDDRSQKRVPLLREVLDIVRRPVGREPLHEPDAGRCRRGERRPGSSTTTSRTRRANQSS